MTIVIVFILVIVIVPIVIGACAIFFHGLFFNKSGVSIRGALFHSVTDEKLSDKSHLSIRQFQLLCEYIAKEKIQTFTLSEAITARKSNKSGVVLVFDDGFEDFYHNVLPIIRRYNISVSIFPVTGAIGKTSQWDVFSTKKHLTEEQLREIAQDGHEIGSHTVSHCDLQMLSKKEMKTELSQSKKTLERILDKKINTLSFPLGSWNKKVWHCALRCGYRFAASYRKSTMLTREMIPVMGTYRFDQYEDLIEKLERKKRFSIATTRASIMPQFARGTSLWKFRKEYKLFNYLFK